MRNHQIKQTEMPGKNTHNKNIWCFLDGIPQNSLNLDLLLGHQQVKLSKTQVSPWFRPSSRSAHAFGAALGLGSLAFVGGDLGTGEPLIFIYPG